MLSTSCFLADLRPELTTYDIQVSFAGIDLSSSNHNLSITITWIASCFIEGTTNVGPVPHLFSLRPTPCECGFIHEDPLFLSCLVDSTSLQLDGALVDVWLYFPGLKIIVIGLTTVLANPTTRAVCPEDYSPCVCDLTANGLEVTCVVLALAEVVDVFFRTQNLFLYSVSLTTSATGLVALPADLLSDKRAQNIHLNCPSAASPKLSLTIDPASFEFTRFNTTRFEIHDCDLAGQTDMKFLNGFVALNTLHLENTLNVEAMGNLPSLPALKELAVVNCTGLGNVVFPDLTPTRLERLHLDGNGLNDEAVANIFIALGSSSSVSSLKFLSLANNALTKIPTIASFSQLITYELSYNDVPFMSLSTLIFGPPVNFVGLKNLSLMAIEGDAFQGNFTYAQVNLENNKLTEFREDVFKSMLQQMTIQPPAIGGQVLVTGNPFDCGCPLAWLIRDNQILLPSVKNGVCGGFFRFEDLNPDAYGNC